MRLKSFSVLLAVLAVLGCGSSDAMTAPSYADVSGSFAGPISGTSQGVVLSANVVLTITQTSGTLSGSYALTGTANGTAISGTGTMSGTVAPGNNPSVNLNVVIAGCPAVQNSYSGSYDSANRRLTITGPLYLLNANCTIAVTYQLTLVLGK